MRKWVRVMLRGSVGVSMMVLSTSGAFGQDAAAGGPPEGIEEIRVFGSPLAPEGVLRVDPALPGSHEADAAALLSRTPGGAVLGNGPVSSQVQLRGLSGLRVNTRVDGQRVAPGGPNLMDPPLHYAPKALLETVEVHRGIASVSTGSGIGGHVNAHLVDAPFGADATFRPTGRITAAGSTVDEGYDAGAWLALANDRHRVQVLGHFEQGDDAEFPGGDIVGSSYERLTLGVGYAFRIADGHEISLDYRRHETDPTGNPVFPLDIALFESDFARARYAGTFGEVGVALEVGWVGIDHEMANYLTRPRPAGVPRVEVPAESETFTWKVSVEAPLLGGRLEVGTDGLRSEHSATITRPDTPGFEIGIFNEAEADHTGVYAEWTTTFRERWSVEAGIRYERVEMDTEDVFLGTSPPVPPPVVALVNGFNAQDRAREDDNLHAVLKLRFEVDPSLTLHAGIARKVRSPFYVERYAFLPVEVTAGLADGNNTIGNIDLEPEEGLLFDLGFDWRSDDVTFTLRGFYHRIDDFIQSTPFDATPTTLAAGVNPATALTSPLTPAGPAAFMAQFMGPGGVAPSGPVEIVSLVNGDATPLMSRNVDAELYGFDASLHWILAEDLWLGNDRLELDGVLTYVRGKRRDIGDDLYRITPLRSVVALTYGTEDWSLTVEGVLVDRQDHVSRTNGEVEAAGHGVVNLYAQWAPRDDVVLTGGIENVLDHRYRDALSGYNRVVGSDVPVFRSNAFAGLDPDARLPGPGVGGFLRVTWRF